MNARIFRAVFALTAMFASSALAQAQSSTGQHAGLTNPGFEEPRVEEGRFALVETLPGWKTTDTHFEIWGTGFKEVPAHEGTQFVELNAYIDGTLFQDSTGIPRGSVLEFTFAHRGRSGDDTMMLTITDLGADNALEGGDDTILFAKQYTTGNDAWAVYDSTTEPKIKALGNTVMFAYSAISTATGELGEGNLLDAANFGVGVVSEAPPKNAMVTAGGSETNELGMEFKLIPAGTFMMGSPESEEGHQDDETQHEVTITRDYYLGITEVTQSQWQQVMGTAPWTGQENVEEGKENAASYISWNDADYFCRRLSKHEGRTYRLPTEAEWEYACRAGTTTPYSFGDDASELEQYAWHHGSKPTYASQVKQKRPNGFGLYDMHGNVWELCQDWQGEYPQGSITDPTGPTSGANRIMRGGSYATKAPLFRTAYRNARTDLAERLAVIGLRVVLVPRSDSGQLALNEVPPENAMKLDVDGGAFAFGYRTTVEPGFTEFPNTDSPHPGITRRNRTDGEYFSFAQNTRETELKAQETSLVHYPAKSEGSGVLCPGQNPGDIAIARFTAMNDGEYHFQISAELIEEDPTGAGVTIYIDGQAVAEKQLTEHLVPWTKSFQRNLTAGQTVDIDVDSGVDQNWEKDHVLITAQAWTTGPAIATVTMVTAGDSETNEADGTEHILTRDLEQQKGAVWTGQTIDFNEDFSISAEIYLGTKDNGADGLALVFQAKGNHIVSDGGGLGYQGISPSIVIEFDTYHNGDKTPKQAVNVNNNDPVEDHVGLRTDGNPKHIRSDYVVVDNLEDGKYHPITFEWNAAEQTLSLTLDGKQLFKEKTVPKNGLAGQQVYFGFTAATGGLTNEHKVRSISFSAPLADPR